MRSSSRTARARVDLGALPFSWRTVALVVVASFVVGTVASSADYEMPGYLVIVALVFAVVAGLLYAHERTGRIEYLVLAVGIAARVVGSLARYEVLYGLYEGSGDAGMYYDYGLRYAAQIRHLDFSFIGGDVDWGTQFLRYAAGFVLALTGPTAKGGFLVFSLLGFAGLVVLARAAARYAGADLSRYLLWLALWPSLVFWPSSIGKEAMMVMGISLAVAGFAGLPRVGSWFPFAVGLTVLGYVRPHVAALAVLAMAAAALNVNSRNANLGRKYFQAPLWIAGFILAWGLALNAIGAESTAEVTDVVLQQAEGSSQGGSQVAPLGTSPLRAPEAIITTLFRPFPWEADGVTAFLSAAETFALMVLVWVRRRRLWQVIRGWRSSRMVAFSVVFIPLYALMLGYSMGNLGIIARQRSIMLPFVLLLIHLAGRKESLERPSTESTPLEEAW